MIQITKSGQKLEPFSQKFGGIKRLNFGPI